MQDLQKIIERCRTKASLTSQKSMIYNCEKCKDTGWILDDSNNLENIAKKCTCINKNKINKLWNLYGLSPEKVKTLNSYESYDELTTLAKEKAFNYITNFNTIKKLENNWFALMGQSGAGKSHIAITIGSCLINKNILVVYMPYTEVLIKLKQNSINGERYVNVLNNYMKAPVLIIDDLFKDKIKNEVLINTLSDIDIKHIYPLLNYRYYNNLPTIFSTECTPELLRELDKSLGGRILERSLNNIIVFNGDQYDYRVRSFLKH